MDSLLLPTVERTLDLGGADFATSYLPVPLALDAQADRLYVSLSPSRTLVLNANSLAPAGEIPFGGALSIHPDAQRLYIGVPGDYAYNPDGTTGIKPAELKLIDTSNLALLRSAIYSSTSTTPPRVAVDAIHNRIYVTQDGITIADATTLDAQGTLSGTFPIPGAPVPNYSAVEAAIDPQRQRLFVSLNNGIPGSNNGNVLFVYDLTTGQVIRQDPERSVLSLALDPQTGEVVVTRSHIATYAATKIDAQGNLLKRLDGASGWAQIDSARNRVYLLELGEHRGLKVLDRDMNLLGVIELPADMSPQGFILDHERDRLLILQSDGKLLVLKGLGQSIGAPRAELAPIPDRTAVLAIHPAPDTARVFAIFAPDEYTGHSGRVLWTQDGGASWGQAAGLPAAVTDLEFFDQTGFAAAGGNGATQGYGIWRSNDGGSSWLPASHDLSDLNVARLAVSPDFGRDATLFALSRRGVFRSTDRGATWTSLADRYRPLLNEQAVSFTALAVSPNFAQDNTLLLGHIGGLWRSTDRGATWTIIDGGPAANRLAYAPDGSIVLAIDYAGVHRSDDGGLTWQLFNDGLDPSSSTIGDVQINDREAVILATSFDQPGVVYRRAWNETAWQRVPVEAGVTALALTPAGGLLIGTTTGTLQEAP